MDDITYALDSAVYAVLRHRDKLEGEKMNLAQAIDELLSIANQVDMIECYAPDAEHLQFRLPGNQERVYQVKNAYSFMRSMLARLAAKVDQINIDSVMSDHHEGSALRNLIETRKASNKVPDGDIEAVKGMLSQIKQNEELLKSRGVVRVNPYGFDIILQSGSYRSRPLRIRTSNTNGQPVFFCMCSQPSCLTTG